MAWAYYDKSGFLHVVDNLGVAVENTKGIVVETDIPCEGGFPLVDGKQIIYDSKLAKTFFRGESEKEEIETPEQIEALIDKIFMKEYSFAIEDHK